MKVWGGVGVEFTGDDSEFKGIGEESFKALKDDLFIKVRGNVWEG